MNSDWQTPRIAAKRRDRGRAKRSLWTLLIGLALLSSVAWLLVEFSRARQAQEAAKRAKNERELMPDGVAEIPKTLQPNSRNEPPPERPIPEVVHQFLQEEQSRNAQRCAAISNDYQLPIQEDFAIRFCKPVWDYRSDDIEVLWFYAFQGASLHGESLVVFGVADDKGQPLFQHPSMAGDPLALLEAQYQSLQWMQCEEPREAFIVAVLGPWPGAGATVDIFGLSHEDLGRRWRVADTAHPEDKEALADELIALLDTNGDGFRDWATYRPGANGVYARVLLYQGEGKGFASSWENLAPAGQTPLAELYERVRAGENPAFTLMRKGRTPLAAVGGAATAPAEEPQGTGE